jgi:hypothetical protein
MGHFFRTLSLTIIVLAVLTASGCAQNKSLTRPQAAKLIHNALNKNRIAVVASGHFCTNLDLASIRAFYNDMRLIGPNLPESPFYLLASLEPQGLSILAPASEFRCPFGQRIGYLVTLTPKGQDIFKEWPSAPQGDGTVFKPVVATNDVVQVTGIVQGATPTSATAEFTYQWKNTQIFTILKALQPQSEMPAKATASLRLYDDGWRITGMAF